MEIEGKRGDVKGPLGGNWEENGEKTWKNLGGKNMNMGHFRGRNEAEGK